MKNISVVVIEDEEDILELIRYNLRREGFNVEGATSGEKGLNFSSGTPIRRLTRRISI